MTRKLWLMALYEYKRHVWQKKFVLVLLSMPAMIALTIGLVALAIALTENSDAVGYVDHSGLLAHPDPAPLAGTGPNDPAVDKPVPLLPFPSGEAARQALEAKEIQAYYVLGPDYLETKEVELVYFEPPAGRVSRQFSDFLQINLLHDLPAEVASRAVAGSNLIVRWPDDAPGGAREFSQRTFLNNFVPLIIAFSLIFLLIFASGYLMGAVVEEKENRTLEVLVTSLSPNQLIAGKVVGILGVTLTQVAGWSGCALLGVWVGGTYLDVGLLQNLTIEPRLMANAAVITIPTLVMAAALMTAVGATVTELQEAQQVTGFFVIPFMIPLWLLQPVMEHPDSPLVVAMSLFPFTSVMTSCVRLAFSEMPAWQIAVSATIASLGALGALWLAGRAFRLGMLRYGKRLNWRELWSRGRPQAAPGGAS